MCRRRTVIKEVTEVGVALAAQHLVSSHAKAVISAGSHGFVRNCGPEARPPSTGVELGVRAEYIVAATDALVGPFLMQVPVLTCEGHFCPFLPGHIILIFTELLSPFFLGLHNLIGHS